MPEEEEDNDEDLARMRELLLSTQDEVDRIIQASNNVQDVYTSSQQVTNANHVGVNYNGGANTHPMTRYGHRSTIQGG